MVVRDVEESKLRFLYISNLATYTSINIQLSLPLGTDKSNVRVGDPLIRIHRVVAVCVLWPELHLPLLDNGRNYAPEHAVRNEFSHALARPKSISPHVISRLGWLETQEPRRHVFRALVAPEGIAYVQPIRVNNDHRLSTVSFCTTHM